MTKNETICFELRWRMKIELVFKCDCDSTRNKLNLFVKKIEFLGVFEGIQNFPPALKISQWLVRTLKLSQKPLQLNLPAISSSS